MLCLCQVNKCCKWLESACWGCAWSPSLGCSGHKDPGGAVGGRFPVFTTIIQCSCWRDSGLKKKKKPLAQTRDFVMTRKEMVLLLQSQLDCLKTKTKWLLFTIRTSTALCFGGDGVHAHWYYFPITNFNEVSMRFELICVIYLQQGCYSHPYAYL